MGRLVIFPEGHFFSLFSARVLIWMRVHIGIVCQIHPICISRVNKRVGIGNLSHSVTTYMID